MENPIASTQGQSERKQLELELEFVMKQLGNVKKVVSAFEEKINNSGYDGTEYGMSLLDVKSHLLLMYCTRLLLYIAKRMRGESVSGHELLNQMCILSWISDKVRNIQKQCQYSIDKLLQHVKHSQSNSNPESSKITVDDLSHRPDIADLRPLDQDEANKEKSDSSKYQPLKLNPTEMGMDDPATKLTKKQQRLLEKHKREVRRGDIHQYLRSELTNLPEEEHFHMNLRAGKKEKELEEFEESMMTRTKQSKGLREFRIFKGGSFFFFFLINCQLQKQKKERRIQQSHGENIDAFVSNMTTELEKNTKLARFSSGGPSFANTIGVFHKNKPLSNFAKLGVKGPWYMRKKLAWKMSKKGQQALSRRKWKKSHPLPFNPSKLVRMHGKTRKTAKKLLGIANKSRKLKRLTGKK
ncbi:neuroguidin [Reticulomyxa filosa]|uniref:Neuroguidin n=1 Tax=Reticulomyxa filosa TaxID=46433 RepID=X6N814_RETFI|nr:neuroguidin [Reticulomyxa filosa]|eukprot:ETO22206.1 neuroguidin [Reticulomyxa filosa]